MTAALYHALIVEHDRTPHNHGPLADATHTATVDNPLCGDVVTLSLIVDGATIERAMFEARGCALCRAAGSLLTVRVTGATVPAALALARTFDDFVHARGSGEDGLGELVAFRGVQAARSRRTCAVLPARALLAALAAT